MSTCMKKVANMLTAPFIALRNKIESWHSLLLKTIKRWLEIFLKKESKEKKAERCWCGTHLLYHRAFAPPNLSNPPKSLCKRQKERKRKIKCHASQERKVLLKTRFQKDNWKGDSYNSFHLAQRLTAKRLETHPRRNMILSRGINCIKYASNLRFIILKFPMKGNKDSFPIKK